MWSWVRFQSNFLKVLEAALLVAKKFLSLDSSACQENPPGVMRVKAKTLKAGGYVKELDVNKLFLRLVRSYPCLLWSPFEAPF